MSLQVHRCSYGDVIRVLSGPIREPLRRSTRAGRRMFHLFQPLFNSTCAFLRPAVQGSSPYLAQRWFGNCLLVLCCNLSEIATTRITWGTFAHRSIVHRAVWGWWKESQFQGHGYYRRAHRGFAPVVYGYTRVGNNTYAARVHFPLRIKRTASR